MGSNHYISRLIGLFEARAKIRRLLLEWLWKLRGFLECDFQYSTAEQSFQELLKQEDGETPVEGAPRKVQQSETSPLEETLRRAPVKERLGERQYQSRPPETLAWKWRLPPGTGGPTIICQRAGAASPVRLRERQEEYRYLK